MTPPPEIAQDAITYVLTTFGLHELGLDARHTVESAGPDGWCLHVWIGLDLGQRVWVARNGGRIGLNPDALHRNLSSR